MKPVLVPIEAERATLGAMLLNQDAIAYALDLLGPIGNEHFSIASHALIYDAIITLYQDADPTDLVSLCTHLESRGEAEKAGGITYVAELTNAVETSAGVKHHANLVLEQSRRRKLLAIAQEANNAISKAGATSQEVAAQLEESLTKLAGTDPGSEPEHIGSIIPRVLESIERMRTPEYVPPGVPTGVSGLDHLLKGSGYIPGTLNVIAARPSVGKSAIAINMAINAAAHAHPVLFFSLEMDNHSVGERILSCMTQTKLEILGGTFLPHVQDGKITSAKNRLSTIPIHIADNRKLDIYRLRAQCRRFCGIQYPLTPIIILDYLQLAVRRISSTNQMNERLGEFTQECKALAMELHCPILLLSQLNRGAERDDNPFHSVSSLKGCGNIEEDADTIMIAVKECPEFLNNHAKKIGVEPSNLVYCGLVKQRSGPTGAFTLLFDKDSQHIQDLKDYNPHQYQPALAMEEEEDVF